MRRNVIRIIAAGMVSVLVLGGCGKGENLPELKDANYQMEQSVKAEVRDIEDFEQIPAYVMGELQILSFKRSGKIGEIKVPVGKAIHKGDVIAVLSNEELDTQIADIDTQIADRANQKSDAVALIQNEIAQRRLEKKYSEDEESKEVCDIEVRKLERKARYEEALCGMDLEELYEQREALEKQRAKAYITAPSDGQIIDMVKSESGEGYIQVGEDVEAGQGVIFFEGSNNKYVITDSDGINLNVEGKRLAVRGSGGVYEVKMKNYGKSLLKAAEKLGLKPLRRFRLVDKDAKLALGQKVLFEVHDNERKQVLAVPSDAVERDGDERYVYVVKDGEKEKRELQIGVSTRKYVEVLEGLSEGEEVAVSRYREIPESGEEPKEYTVERGDYEDLETVDITPDRKDMEIQQIKYTGENGVFQKLTVKEGDTVQAGDIIGYVKAGTKESEVLQAQLSLEEARDARSQLDTDTVQQLNELKKSLGKAESAYEKESLGLQIQAVNLQYNSSVRSANAAVEKAREEYNHLYEQYTGEPIRAGISGLVTQATEMKKGDVVTSEILCTIARTNAAYYYFDGYIYNANRKVHITDADGKKYTGKIMGMNQYFSVPEQEMEDWYRSYIVLNHMDDIAMETVQIEKLSLPDVLYLPADAVLRNWKDSSGLDEYVYVKNGDSVERREVVIGDYGWDIDKAYIYSGLEEGEVVLCYDLQ